MNQERGPKQPEEEGNGVRLPKSYTASQVCIKIPRIPLCNSAI